MDFKEFDEIVDNIEDIVENKSAYRTKLHKVLLYVYKKGEIKGVLSNNEKLKKVLKDNHFIK